MMFYTFLGVGIYGLFVWFMWSNDKKSGKTQLTFKEKLNDEVEEIVVAVVGAILWLVGGEGVLDTCCEAIGMFFSAGAQDLCISAQVNTAELLNVIGGATFGSVLLFAVKYSKIKANKKLNE